MTIATRLKLNILVSAAVVLIMSLAFAAAFVLQYRASERVGFSDALSSGMYDLNLLTEYFIKYPEERPKQQWNIQYESLMEVLGDASRESGHGFLDQRMAQGLQDMNVLFQELARSYERPAGARPDDPVVKARQEQLGDLIILKLREIAGITERISFESTRDIRDTSRSIAVLFTVLALVLLLLAIRFSLRMKEVITEPITRLKEGTEIVRGGDLDHRIPVAVWDELGQLTDSFNGMTDHLKATTVSRNELMAEVAERKAAEEALRRQAALIDLSPDGILVRKLDGTITFWNRGAEELYGWAKAEAVGKLADELLHTRFPEDVEFVIRQLRRTGRWTGELVHRTRDGLDIIVQSFWMAQYDRSGDISEILESNVDITERKAAESEIRRFNTELEGLVEERTAELERANRELESFSYSVSHDLRAPLRAIEGFSRILEEDYQGSLDDEGRRVLSVIVDNTRNMSKLIDDLLAFSRVGRYELKHSPLDMNAMVRAVLDEVVPAGDRGRISLAVHPLLGAKGDPALIRQVWINLLSNAVKFSSKKEHPRIEVGSRETDGAVLYCVKDNGAGFDMAYGSKLFGVFQRLHSVKEFEGTGVGLAITQRIVTRHGGRIWAEAEPGQGATFFFTLPADGAGKG
ncbi:MAG TPA: ATP-binding protein [Deltaproteobacteria bacterium]|mgnify:CR=1 FL=1|nr:ATP-binding protein [Deltaproteobacteria bacterium]HOI07168.1 ATP-binding protein [Deltaproteobacteria bacterium]